MKKFKQKTKRKIRVRSKIEGSKDRPRLSVFRSNNFIYAQLIDDLSGKTILGVSEKNLDDKNKKPIEKAKETGSILAKLALEKKIKKVIFDKGSYKYHGRVKAFAQGAREGGLEF
ncbi:MAG: 50S ribosomal protein L18 [Candidatus Levybacteria bacterium]|nr:50S ribosomal protein L18 [Candidatus Levybacteria bacterium]